VRQYSAVKGKVALKEALAIHPPHHPSDLDQPPEPDCYQLLLDRARLWAMCRLLRHAVKMTNIPRGQEYLDTFVLISFTIFSKG
jgi:hypothetical protein